MSPDERLVFESNPHHQEGIRLRRWEDALGKRPDACALTLGHFRSLLEGLLAP